MRTGSTLYAHTNEWIAGRFDLPGLIREVAARDLGPGLELVGFQSFRGFPRLDADQIRQFRSAVEETGLEPSCLATNADIALRRDHWLNDEEAAEYLAAQIDVAAQLDFPVARIQIGASPGVLDRIAPVAERANVRLGMELHAPEGATTPKILAVREAYDRIGSDHLGFIPDFSATMHAVPQGMLDAFVRDGLPAELIAPLVEIWADDGLPHERFNRFAELARGQGAPDGAIGATRLAYTMFGRLEPASWREIMPQVVHIHGKFYEIDDSGSEPSIDYATLLPLFDGFTGYMSSEWEGHAFANLSHADSFALVRAHQDLVRRLAG